MNIWLPARISRNEKKEENKDPLGRVTSEQDETGYQTNNRLQYGDNKRSSKF